MKQIIFSFLITAICVLMLSCDDQGKLGLDESNKGFNLRVAPDKNTFDISVGDPEINFTIYSDTRTIATVNIFVDFLQFCAAGPTPRAVLNELLGNMFGTNPSVTVPIKLSEFAAAVELTVDELGEGDLF